MSKPVRPLLALLLGCSAALHAAVPARRDPDRVLVHSGKLTLQALLWRPEGRGPFPAVLFNHGSGTTPEREVERASAIGRVFAEHGYILLYPFRRGCGLSADQGTSVAALLDREIAANGQEARNALQLKLLEGGDLDDASAALAYLRGMPEVDKARVVVAGHSFGASLSLLLAEREPALRAVVLYSGSAASWDHSPLLRARLVAAVDRATAPILFLQAGNDYSLAPARELAAEMARRGKTHRVRIYPAVGKTPLEGHNFLFERVDLWEQDVFTFLGEHVANSHSR